MIYFKTNDTEYPAEIAGKVADRDWGGRESKAVTLAIGYADAAALFVDGLIWSIVQREQVPKLDETGQETGQTEEYVQEWDNSDYCVAGSITDNRDGTCTCKMGKKTEAETQRQAAAESESTVTILLGMESYAAVQEEKAQALRACIVQASASLSDKSASEAPELFGQLTGDGSLVKSGTRINWNGTVKRAAVDLWDNAQSTPEAAPNLWEDIQYKQGYRIIPETITVGLAFAKGEKGWWQDALYESLLDANVFNPAVNPDGWKLVEASA